MYFVVIGILIILANLLGIGPMANWTWNITGDLWKFCVPFVFAAIWWAWADATGYYKRREMEKMDAKRQSRREEQMVALGTDRRTNRKKQKATRR
jgi:small Trp-rich protein